jgi:cyclophilin family peptidyl-prolyl cis-trans isomerase
MAWQSRHRNQSARSHRVGEARRASITRGRSGSVASAVGEPMFDSLESRQMLWSGPMISNLPTTAMMENALNTVVRMQTNFGSIDIELYDTINPITVTNFLSYIKGGDWEETFFHRTIDVANLGIGILQGGGFRYQDGLNNGLAVGVTQKAPIVNEFNRQNKERTIAMAKTALGPNTATSQWYFNTVDNPDLDSPANNGGYTVFGKIIQGWNVVQAIDALQTKDLDAQLSGNPFGTLYDAVPVGPGFNPNVGATEATLVYLTDVEIIKSFGQSAFYSHAAYFPEGYRSNTTTGRVDLINPSATGQAYYQVLAHYANGLRDQVVWTGIIDGKARTSVFLYDSTKPTLNLVRKATPFAIEVRSTGPIQAQFNHVESGNAVNEVFVTPGNMPAAWLNKWSIANGEKSPTTQNFILLYNPTGATITIYVEVIRRGQQTLAVLPKTIEAYRRGGLAIHQFPALPNESLSYRLASTQPFIASLSAYTNITTNKDGSGTLGTPLGGLSKGVVAGALLPSGGNGYVDLFYTPGPTAVPIVLDFILNNGNVISSAQVLSPLARRVTLNLANIAPALPVNEFFTIRYRVQGNAVPVTMAYRASRGGDDYSTSAAVLGTQRTYFPDAYFDPASAPGSYSEVYSLFNPYTGANITMDMYAYAHFGDGTVIQFSSQANMGPLKRIDFVPSLNASVVAKINQSPGFKNFSVSIWTVTKLNGVPFLGASVTQQTRFNGAAGGSTTLGALSSTFAAIQLNGPNLN